LHLMMKEVVPARSDEMRLTVSSRSDVLQVRKAARESWKSGRNHFPARSLRWNYVDEIMRCL